MHFVNLLSTNLQTYYLINYCSENKLNSKLHVGEITNNKNCLYNGFASNSLFIINVRCIITACSSPPVPHMPGERGSRSLRVSLPEPRCAEVVQLAGAPNGGTVLVVNLPPPNNPQPSNNSATLLSTYSHTYIEVSYKTGLSFVGEEYPL